MTELKLTQFFSLVALNGQSSLHMTNSKKVALRSMAAAVILEAYIEGVFTQMDHELGFRMDSLNHDCANTYGVTIFKSILRKNNEEKGDLKWWLKKASSLPQNSMKEFESSISESLKEKQLLEEVPSLLGCDLYFDSAGVALKDYRSNMQEYSRITESFRAEVLEDGLVTDETICMLWLIRESGCLHDLFSRNELEKVNTRMNDLYQSDTLAKTLFPTRIYRGIELGIKQFLRFKNTAVKTTVGAGLNFIFPVIERSQSVFIETEEMFADQSKRLNDVKARLESHGHEFKVLSEGRIPLIKIDNIVYELIPHAVYGKVLIHGVRLLPKRPI